MRARLLVSLVAVVGLFATGCGDDGPDANAERADAREAVGALEAALTDDGFEAETSQDDEGEDDGDLQFESEECRELEEALDGDTDLEGQTVERESKTFTRSTDSGEETVDASVTFADAEALSADLEAMDAEGVDGCIEEAFQMLAEEDDGGEAVEFRDISVDVEKTDLGDDGRRISMTATISTQGVELPMTFELHAVRVERRGAALSAFAIGDELTVDPGRLVEILLTGEAPA